VTTPRPSRARGPDNSRRTKDRRVPATKSGGDPGGVLDEAAELLDSGWRGCFSRLIDQPKVKGKIYSVIEGPANFVCGLAMDLDISTWIHDLQTGLPSVVILTCPVFNWELQGSPANRGSCSVEPPHGRGGIH
jgi:hypothetical protein